MYGLQQRGDVESDWGLEEGGTNGGTRCSSWVWKVPLTKKRADGSFKPQIITIGAGH